MQYVLFAMQLMQYYITRYCASFHYKILLLMFVCVPLTILQAKHTGTEQGKLFTDSNKETGCYQSRSNETVPTSYV